jgi:hypothetical protein
MFSSAKSMTQNIFDPSLLESTDAEPMVAED